MQVQLKQNDDILFCWSVLTASWSHEIATTILEMTIDLWIITQGLLMAAWCMCRALKDDPKEDE